MIDDMRDLFSLFTKGEVYEESFDYTTILEANQRSDM